MGLVDRETLPAQVPARVRVAFGTLSERVDEEGAPPAWNER